MAIICVKQFTGDPLKVIFLNSCFTLAHLLKHLKIWYRSAMKPIHPCTIKLPIKERKETKLSVIGDIRMSAPHWLMPRYTLVSLENSCFILREVLKAM